MEIAQEEKAARLQQAVINSSALEISKVYEELGYVEMSAPALGLACRFRGLEVVRALVQRGATFDFPSTEEIEEAYNCYVGKKHANYRTNYSMYLLKAFGKDLKILCLTGMTMEQSANREDKEPLSFLSDEERVDVLGYLMENREKIAFQPEELLYYAIFMRDTVIEKYLREQGVKISETRVKIITDGATATNSYWFEYVLLTERVADEDYLDVMQQLFSDFDGRLFHFTDNIYAITKKRFRDFRIFEFFFEHFKKEKMNKRKVMCDLIDGDVLEALPLVEKAGWLEMPRKRDEMITYASEEGKTEILAWLLEYKNRTADLAAEQVKSEKKLMRELNMAPDSVAALKKIWSYRKQDDGTLVITNYKGMDTEVTVPEKIGKSIVTVVGDGAFTGRPGSYNPKVTYEQAKQHSVITRIALPETLRSIGAGVFCYLPVLEEVRIPAGVKEIGEHAFRECGMLKNITLPSNLKRIGSGAFEKCSLLQDITLPEKVVEIGASAFQDCNALQKIAIPKKVKKIERRTLIKCQNLERVELYEGVQEIGAYAFQGCDALQDIMIPKTVEKIGSYAFANCPNLKDVQLCEGVKQIDPYAFQFCTSLKSITIPETVEEIGECAFADCHNLEEVCICGEVKKMGALALIDCKHLKRIKIQKSIPNRVLGETFWYSPNMTVYCPKGSKTEAYCKKQGISYEYA